MNVFVIQLLNEVEGQWEKLRICPVGFVEEDARDMLEESRKKIVKRKLRLIKVIPPPYIPPEIVVLDA